MRLSTGIWGRTSVNDVLLYLIDDYLLAFTRRRLAIGIDLDPMAPRARFDSTLLDRGVGTLFDYLLLADSQNGTIVCRTLVDAVSVAVTVVADFHPALSWQQVAAIVDDDAVHACGGGVCIDPATQRGVQFVLRVPRHDELGYPVKAAHSMAL